MDSCNAQDTFIKDFKEEQKKEIQTQTLACIENSAGLCTAHNALGTHSCKDGGLLLHHWEPSSPCEHICCSPSRSSTHTSRF